MACKLNVDSCFFDIEKAQVLSELKGDVYMGLPQGCGRLSGNIVRLNKRLHSWKQASRQWHADLTRCLLLQGFLQCTRRRHPDFV